MCERNQRAEECQKPDNKTKTRTKTAKIPNWQAHSTLDKELSKANRKRNSP